MTRRKGMTLLRSGAVMLGALCAALIVLFPVYWIAVSSVKPTRELISPTPTLWPRQFTGRHFAMLFQASDFTAYLVNSTVVSLCTVGLVLVLSVLGAYSLSRFRYPGRELFGRLILFTYIFPGMLLLIPMYSVMQEVKLSNTLTGLVVVNVMLSLPFGVWVLKAFMDSIFSLVKEQDKFELFMREGDGFRSRYLRFHRATLFRVSYALQVCGYDTIASIRWQGFCARTQPLRLAPPAPAPSCAGP